MPERTTWAPPSPSPKKLSLAVSIPEPWGWKRISAWQLEDGSSWMPVQSSSIR